MEGGTLPADDLLLIFLSSADSNTSASQNYFDQPSNPIALNSSQGTSGVYNLLFFGILNCGVLAERGFLYKAFLIASSLIVLPLSALVFYHGWKKEHQASTEASGTRHSDAFAYHMSAMEMMQVLLLAPYFALTYSLPESFDYFPKLLDSISSVKVQFLTLTCAEFYLGVVHPVTYLSLKSSRGVRIRNGLVGCVWVLFLMFAVVSYFCSGPVVMITCLCLVAVDIALASFCCLSVLWALARPGPGDNVEDRAGPSKRKASRTILKIMVTIWLCLSSMLVFFGLQSIFKLLRIQSCKSSIAVYCFTLPSILVLPLLFLQRAGKLSCCKR